MTAPVTVIGGYLGSGKTTLINTILRQADGVRIAVLVNEFGALSIDEDLIFARDGDVISIAGGCICCSFGDNLVGAFTDLLALDPRPDHIVIEASGVAIPTSVAATLSLVPGVALVGIVTLADAETVRARARDKYMGDTILRQLAGTDIVLLSKADLVPDDGIGPLETWLREMSRGAEVIPMVNGQVPNAIVLGETQRDRKAVPEPLEDHGKQYRSVWYEQGETVSSNALSDRLARVMAGVVRAKGFVKTPDNRIEEIHAVGARVTVSAAEVEPRQYGIVCIGLSGRMDLAELDAALDPLGLNRSG